MRQCGDVHLAEDVTQGVFLALVNKAQSLRSMDNAVPWLLRATYLASREAMRKQRRREHHERQAAGQRDEQAMGENNGWEAVGPGAG